MAREASTCDLKELVLKFIPESIGKDIEKVRITKLPSPPAPAPFTNLTCALAASTSGPLASRTAVSKKHIHTRASSAGEGTTFPRLLVWLHRSRQEGRDGSCVFKALHTQTNCECRLATHTARRETKKLFEHASLELPNAFRVTC